MHTFKITYHEGFPSIENSYCDESKIVNNLREFNIKIFRIYEKQRFNLKHKLHNYGTITSIENLSEEISKHKFCDFNAPFNTWQKPMFYKFLIPYHIEIRYNNELLLTDSFDLRHKLILFNLDSNNINDLNVWMNAISVFKKKMN